MFTGIITDVGRVRRIEERGDFRFELDTTFDLGSVDIGASIACSGTCLTVVEKGTGWFAVDVSAETLACTTLGGWEVGSPVNLERSLRIGDEMGGHIVLGHVDGVGEIVSIDTEGDSRRFQFLAPDNLGYLIAAKGSVSINGVSLTVNDVDGMEFGVNIIPHTQQMTTFDHANVGDAVNLEVDVLARYVSRLAEQE